MQVKSDPPTLFRMRELLRYEPESGSFYWKVTRQRSKEGSRAGTLHSKGYRRITVEGHDYAAHRLAWLFETGMWPSLYLDHRDGDRDNNRIGNLREATHSLNAQNQRRPQARSASKILGASFYKQTGKWVAHIYVHGKNKNLGYFHSAEEAGDVYLKAKRQLHAGCTI